MKIISSTYIDVKVGNYVGGGMNMYEGFDIWAFLVGLPLALVIVAIVLLITRKKAKKERKKRTHLRRTI